MLTIRRLALGSGFKYLMESIAVGDGPAPGTSLAAYYEASGTPPGVWMGAGLGGLAGGAGLSPGSVVKEEQLVNVLGRCVDPVSGEPCGRVPNAQPHRFPNASQSVSRSSGRISLTPNGVSLSPRSSPKSRRRRRGFGRRWRRLI